MTEGNPLRDSRRHVIPSVCEESFPHKIATGEKCALAITGWDATNLCKPSRRHQGAALRNPSSFFNIQLKIPRQNRSPFSSRDEYIICFTHRHYLHGTTRLTRGFRYTKNNRRLCDGCSVFRFFLQDVFTFEYEKSMLNKRRWFAPTAVKLYRQTASSVANAVLRLKKKIIAAMTSNATDKVLA